MIHYLSSTIGNLPDAVFVQEHRCDDFLLIVIHHLIIHHSLDADIAQEHQHFFPIHHLLSVFHHFLDADPAQEHEQFFPIRLTSFFSVSSFLRRGFGTRK